MALLARKTDLPMLYALVSCWNQKQEAQVASFFHADTTQKTTGDFHDPTVANDTINSANGSDLATSITLVNETQNVLNRHWQDSLAHNTAVSAVDATAIASDLATAITLANALKAKYNTHRTAANVHFTNDATNVVTSADATDLASLQTLINEMKGDFNAHLISAPLGRMIRLAAP